MSLWHWVRHGPTHQKTLVGWRDVPADLSDSARIARLSEHLPHDAVLVSSDLVRASATADAIAENRHRLPHDPELREFHFGDWDGRPFDDVAETDPELSRAYWETPGDVAPPGGESWNMAAARVHGAVDRLRAAYPDRPVIVVAHIGVILTQVQRALRLSPVEAIGHRIDNLSVTTIRSGDDGWQMERINHTP